MNVLLANINNTSIKYSTSKYQYQYPVQQDG